MIKIIALQITHGSTSIMNTDKHLNRKIPLEMKEAPRYTLFTLFITLFVLLNSSSSMYAYICEIGCRGVIKMRKLPALFECLIIVTFNKYIYMEREQTFKKLISLNLGFNFCRAIQIEK